MKQSTKILAWLLLFWLAMSVTALAQNGVSGYPAEAGNVSLVLAPLAATALGIERLLETIWGVVETVLRMVLVDPASPRYVEFKTWVSAGAGLLIGVIIASATDLRMFGMLNFPANPQADVFITGLVVGSGSKFTHDIIGIFSEGKRALEQWRRLLEERRQDAS